MNFSYKDIQKIKKVKPNKKKNIIAFEFIDMNNNSGYIISEYNSYCNWLKNRKNTYTNIFHDFLNDLLKSSNNEEKKLSEIIDKFGNIFPDDDLSSNATNTAVGSSNFDLDKVISQTRARGGYEYMSGPYGYGFVVW